MTQGLDFKYFEGFFKSPEQIQKAKPSKTGTVDKLHVPFEPEGEFAVILDGFIRVPENGIYTFRSITDRLYIGNELVLKNNDPVKQRTHTAQIVLSRGNHPIKVIFIKGLMKRDFTIEYAVPNQEKTEIPSSALFHKKK